MFFKKERTNNYYNNPINQNSLYPKFEEDRLLYEIQENRRRINNLAKRIVRLESYLRIRDSSDYSIIDDEYNRD